jgi:glycosyltransferase involved in cell wall biosynthesis
VGVVARLRREKRHDLLLQAVARLRTRFPEVFVLLIGDGPERDAVGAEAAALGLADRVMFTDHLPNRPNPHQLLDVSVCAPRTKVSLTRSLRRWQRPGRSSRRALEVCPTPCVMAKRGCSLPAGRRAAALAEALGSLLDDPARARRMGAGGRAAGARTFHADTVLPQPRGVVRHAARARRTARRGLSRWRG